MAHRRTSSVVHPSTTHMSLHQPNPVLNASGVSFAAALSAAASVLAPVASALPSIRSSLSSDDGSMSLSSLDLTPSTPGTPSKLFPHPPRLTVEDSVSHSTFSRAQLSSQRLVSRLLATLSPNAPGLPLKSPHLAPSPSSSFLSSLPTRAHAPLRRRATFLALITLIILSAWTMLTNSLGGQRSEVHPSTDTVLLGWKSWREKAQQHDSEERNSFLNSASFRAAALSASPDESSDASTDRTRKPNIKLELTPADELAGLTAFMAALPWNALPAHIDPNVPLDPNVILDFDPSHRQARDELAALRRETWQLNPIVLFGRSRHAPTREVSHALEGLGVNMNEVMQFDMADRVDSELVMGVLKRVVPLVDSSFSSTTQLELPLLLIAGQPVRVSEVSSLVESGEMARLLRDAGVRLSIKNKKKKGH